MKIKIGIQNIKIKNNNIMKSLIEYINEQVKITEDNSTESKDIVFDFTDLENAEETLKSFEDQEFCTVEDKKLTVTVTPANYDKLGTIVDILQQYSDTLMQSPKRASNEQYAQTIRKFTNTVNKLNDEIDLVKNAAESTEKEDENNKEDKKDKDEKESE